MREEDPRHVDAGAGERSVEIRAGEPRAGAPAALEVIDAGEGESAAIVGAESDRFVA